jgi:hypothetical protein
MLTRHTNRPMFPCSSEQGCLSHLLWLDFREYPSLSSDGRRSVFWLAGICLRYYNRCCEQTLSYDGLTFLVLYDPQSFLSLHDSALCTRHVM